MWIKNNIPDQSGKTIIVTGANAGIGFEIALALYEKGAHVILACRSLKNGDEAKEKIQKHQGTGTLSVAALDLSSLTSVKYFAENFLLHHQQLDVLINNAGVMTPPASKTSEGYELQFGVNFLGHFALTGYLYQLLKKTYNARVVTVSSQAYLHGKIDFDNLKSENDYNAMREYGQSKLADLIFALELQRKINLKGDRVMSLGAQPGANKSELARHMNQDEFNTAVDRIGGLMEPSQGALSILYAAVAPEVNAGEFFGPDGADGYKGYPIKTAVEPHALDEDVAGKLWKVATDATGVAF